MKKDKEKYKPTIEEKIAYEAYNEIENMIISFIVIVIVCIPLYILSKIL